MDHWRPVERMTLVRDVHHDGCAWLVLGSPVFLRPGEHYRTGPEGLVVRHPDGTLSTHPAQWETRRPG